MPRTKLAKLDLSHGFVHPSFESDGIKYDVFDEDDLIEAIEEAAADKKPIDIIVATKNLDAVLHVLMSAHGRSNLVQQQTAQQQSAQQQSVQQETLRASSYFLHPDRVLSLLDSSGYVFCSLWALHDKALILHV